jgi:hypothetical protein
MRWTPATLGREAGKLGLLVTPEQAEGAVIYRIHRGDTEIFYARGLGNAISFVQGYQRGRVVI